MKKLFFAFLVCLFIIGCSSNNKEDDMLISYMDAKEMIINDGAILLDVRQEDEYNLNHINGALNVALSDINEDSIKDVASSKDNIIIVYCQSGNRSSQAVLKLNALGYNNVYDLGSINNWEE